MKKVPERPTSQHKRPHDTRDLKRPISQYKIQSHIIVYQVFGKILAWLLEYLPRNIKYCQDQ
jgi:hypothetical protein